MRERETQGLEARNERAGTTENYAVKQVAGKTAQEGKTEDQKSVRDREQEGGAACKTGGANNAKRRQINQRRAHMQTDNWQGKHAPLSTPAVGARQRARCGQQPPKPTHDTKQRAASKPQQQMHNGKVHTSLRSSSWRTPAGALRSPALAWSNRPLTAACISDQAVLTSLTLSADCRGEGEVTGQQDGLLWMVVGARVYRASEHEQ